MNKEYKLKLAMARLKGEFLGTLKAITWCWDIPDELKEKLEEKIVKLENQNKGEGNTRI